MAKKSMVEREKKREKLVQKYAAKRAALNEVVDRRRQDGFAGVAEKALSATNRPGERQYQPHKQRYSWSVEEQLTSSMTAQYLHHLRCTWLV